MTWAYLNRLAKTRRWLLFVFLVGLAHAGTYALLVPPWQAPDEPGHYEAACLLGELQRPLTGDDVSSPLQREILANLARHEFWPRVQAPSPAPLPASFAADPFLARSGRQVGDESPLYYLLPALICRANLSIEARLALIRLFGAVLFGLTGVVAVWGGGVFLLPLFLVLLPMPAFIAGSANNDALAMLTATAVAAAVLRIQCLGWTWRRGAGVLVLLALALTSKKTNSFLALWVALLGLAAAWRWVSRRGWRPHALAGLAIGAAAVTIFLLLPSPAPASWRSTGGPWAMRRGAVAQASATLAPNPWAVLVTDASPRAFIRMMQTLAGSAVHPLRGQAVTATAWVRSPDGQPAPGRLTLRDPAGYSQASFEADEHWQQVTVTRTVALTATHVKLAIAPGAGRSRDEMGSLLVKDIALTSQAGEPANVLYNGDFSQPARWGEILLVAPLEDRWQQFAPRRAADERVATSELTRYGLFLLLTFAGFWGNFGWLQRPLPVWVYAGLAAICVTAAAGVWRFLRRPSLDSPGAGRAVVMAWLLAVGLAVTQVLLPMIGRPWQPQGRYLFPALLPIVGLLLVGLDTVLSGATRPRRWVFLLGALLAFDSACLLHAAFVI